jgi:methionyl-tRNA formyltransferase
VPGEIRVEGQSLFAACAEATWIELLELQLEGKKRLAVGEFLHGNQLLPGARLGASTP